MHRHHDKETGLLLLSTDGNDDAWDGLLLINPLP
jgi:hypothetical protein